MKEHFIGIHVPEAIAFRLRGLRSTTVERTNGRLSMKDLPSVSSSGFHLTLVPPGSYDDGTLSKAVSDAAQQQEPFDIDLNGMNVFEHSTIYAQCPESFDALDVLRYSLDKALGVNRELEFVPHVSVFYKLERDQFDILAPAAKTAATAFSWPASFSVEAMTVWGRDSALEPWKAVAYEKFSGGEAEAA